MTMYWFVLFVSFLALTGCGGSNSSSDNGSATQGLSVADLQTNGSCGSMSQEACEAFQLVNLERINAGLNALSVNGNCVTAAQYHADDMNQFNYFSHDGLTESWSERFRRFGVTGLRGENIARSSGSPASVVNQWMNSTGHRNNILNPDYQSAGMGESNGYWVQCFSGS